MSVAREAGLQIGRRIETRRRGKTLFLRTTHRNTAKFKILSGEAATISRLISSSIKALLRTPRADRDSQASGIDQDPSNGVKTTE
jgi:hypothetical protein